MPVHNRADLLIEAVESVLGQTYRPIEIIISDDGSTDGTSDVAARLEAENPGVVRCLRNQNRGPGPAREAGRREARGEFIQYLDSDDLLLPGKFEIQVQALRNDPAAGVAYGITRLADLEGRTLQEPFKWTGRSMDRLFPSLLVDRWWCTHTPLYRRSVCDRIGPWSDLRYSQDWEYDARVGGLGVPLVYCDALVSIHRVHGGSRQTGHGRWLAPAERARFFRRLFTEACRAGVSPGDPEMRHFSRWVFFHARQCGAEGDAEAARECHSLAVEAGRSSARWDVPLYGLVATMIGWTVLGRGAAAVERVWSSPPGSDSLPQRG